MAYPSTAPSQANRNSIKVAAAFLNITIKDSAGNPRRIGGLPLYAENKTHVGILAKLQATEEAKAGSKESKFKFVVDYELRLNDADEVVTF
jgi:hypothetical protein